jgi:3-hydroxyisobutyrate dehydrogenase-like beta-hydroxyacid dehydrogenase
MLPDGKAVRLVLLGPEGVVAGLQPGGLLIDMSSSSPVDTRALAGQLGGLGFALVDAPVSGGVVKAVAGSLAIMAGGEAAAIAAVEDVFAVLGKVFLTGASGSGHAMKAINNFLSATTLAITSEALIAGSKCLHRTQQQQRAQVPGIRAAAQVHLRLLSGPDGEGSALRQGTQRCRERTQCLRRRDYPPL